jgi:hypothetical protein
MFSQLEQTDAVQRAVRTAQYDLQPLLVMADIVRGAQYFLKKFRPDDVASLITGCCEVGHGAWLEET